MQIEIDMILFGNFKTHKTKRFSKSFLQLKIIYLSWGPSKLMLTVRIFFPVAVKIFFSISSFSSSKPCPCRAEMANTFSSVGLYLKSNNCRPVCSWSLGCENIPSTDNLIVLLYTGTFLQGTLLVWLRWFIL